MPSRAGALLALLSASLACAGVPAFGTPGEAVSAQETPTRIRRPRLDEIESPASAGDASYGRHEFYWTRAAYTDVFGQYAGGSGSRGRRWRGRPFWTTDYPKADRQFLVVLKRMIRLNVYGAEHPVGLADPALRRYPVIYAVEVGHMDLTQDEVHGLRDYLNAGGFLIVDDFWGPREWDQFEYNMRRVLPGRPIVELPRHHPIFSAYYQIDSTIQVPNVGNAEAITRGYPGAHTWEHGGYVPHVRGILDDKGRLMVVINFNTDLGDAWEWAEDPMYPLRYSTYACEMAANMIVYGMSH